MKLIQHKKGGVYLPKYGLQFPKGKAVEVKDEKLAEKILRNQDFQEVSEKPERIEKKGGKYK